jgi:L-threonylcarbamoyladenylate synthase
LTLVLPKTDDIPHEVTAGRDSVALRAPNHPLTLMLLRILDRPLAGPSANKSSHVSPTTAQHVRDELGDEVDMILDGGPCDVGIESTVLDLTSPRPTILRPGGVTREQIEAVIGPVDLFSGAVDPAIAATSPGQQEKHYAPRTPAYRFESADRVRVNGAILALDADAATYARTFYARLRELDQSGVAAIYIEMPPDTPQWTAVRDRIIRATQTLPTT